MKISKTTIIKAPAALVFKTLMDVDLATKWVPYLESYEIISETENMIGSRYRSQINQNGMKYEQIAEIKSYIENQFIEWTASCPFYDGVVEYFLLPLSNAQTEFTYISNYNYKGLMKIWSWLVKSKFQKISDDQLDLVHKKFKACVEAEFQLASSLD